MNGRPFINSAFRGRGSRHILLPTNEGGHRLGCSTRYITLTNGSILATRPLFTCPKSPKFKILPEKAQVFVPVGCDHCPVRASVFHVPMVITASQFGLINRHRASRLESIYQPDCSLAFDSNRMALIRRFTAMSINKSKATKHVQR